ncbi:Actin-related protein 5 [Exaiptasia diaphana]|nr:Actin-related protein 5 [Exaiptasia diaphana]
MVEGDSKSSSSGVILKFKDEETSPDSFYEYPSSVRDGKVPLIIDNGGYQCRVGWATDSAPKLVFRNLVAKSRGRKGEPDSGGIAVGNDIGTIEMLRWSVKTQFDRDVVTHYECQEQVLDHAFSHLSINTPGAVNHPIVMTEPVCNPNYCRQLMSELLFECYHVPSIAYGIDTSLNTLIVSSGYQVSHVLPIVNGRLDAQNCKRINLGGASIAWYMQRLIQLKHPTHAAQITLARAQRIQLPYHQPQVPQNGPAKNEEKEKIRRQKQGKRLQEINAKRREEKIAREEAKLKELKDIKDLESTDEEAFKTALKGAGFQSVEALSTAIKNLTSSMERRKEKLVAMQTAAEMDEEEIYEARQQRRQRREELATRRSHASMELRDDGTTRISHKKSKEDTFGQNDEDWMVYRAINKDAGDSDSEKEQEELTELENLLKKHDKEFARNEESKGGPVDLAEYHQLHLGVERIRVPEILFEPAMVGLEQAGITDTIDFVLGHYSPERQNSLVQVCGSNLNRISKSLLETGLKPEKLVCEY